VLARDGASARTAAGAALPAVTEALRGAWNAIAFPDPAVPFLVVNATWRCADGRCAAVLGESP
jgi:hypothetical protein